MGGDPTELAEESFTGVEPIQRPAGRLEGRYMCFQALYFPNLHTEDMF